MREFVKSTLVYRALRNALGPMLKSEGFRRTTSTQAGWYRPQGNSTQLRLSFSVDFYGGADWGNVIFGAVSEVLMRDPKVSIGTVRGSDFCRSLTRSELDAWRRVQSRINLRRPMSDYVASSPANGAKMHLRFLPIIRPYEEGEYFHFDYYAMDDVEEICTFLVAVTPGVLTRFLANQTPQWKQWCATAPDVDNKVS